MFWGVLLYLWIIPKITTGQFYGEPIDDASLLGLQRMNLDSLYLTLSSRILLDVNLVGRQSLTGYLGWIPKDTNTTYTPCVSDESDPGESVCLHYRKGTRLLVTRDADSGDCDEDSMTCHAVECHRVRWVNHIGGAMDCFNLGEVEWYGGSQMPYQRWPLEGHSRSFTAAVTGDPLHHPSGNVVENLWLTSSGYALYVEHDVPLYVSFNDSGSNSLCFTTSAKKHPYKSGNGTVRRELDYTICSARSVLEAYRYSLHRWIDRPEDTPDEMMMQQPVWSTWARYKRDIDQEVVTRFADEIVAHEFPPGQLEIDDRWEDCYGNLAFDSRRFPDPSEMTDHLTEYGFFTSLWVHPFCNKECDCFDEGAAKDLWVKDAEGKTMEVTWWNGDSAAMLDATHPDAADWFAKRLGALQSQHGITTFKFDAGEVLWLDGDFRLHDPAANIQPNLYSKAWANLANRLGPRVEVRTGFESQSLPLFVRMFDKSSRWDFANGLRTLVPSALQLSLMGYFFVLPDMVGGNNYDALEGSLPDRELYVRWLQAVTFMPLVQFSISPWDYDSEVVTIARKMVLLHEKYHPIMAEAARESVLTGEPIIRPLWWIAPDDPEALRCDSQFLVGEDLMVAPVLTKGRDQRHIYLPEGKWRDVQRGKTHNGPQWIFSYDAPLNFLPFFERHH